MTGRQAEELGRQRDEQCLEWLKLHKERPARTLGRELRQQWPELFPNIEAARQWVLRTFGRSGRPRKETKSLHRPPREAGYIPESVRAVPEDIEFREPHKWMVLGDIHAPFHDAAALETMLEAAREAGCDALYLNGDVADNFHFSRHFKKPLFGSVKEHIGVTIQVLAAVCEGWDRVIYKYGNHDDWYERWLARQDDPDLIQATCRTFPEIFQFEEIGIRETVLENQLALIGKLPILHGHEMQRGFVAPINPARGAFLRIKDTVAINHYHRTSLHIERTGIEGKLVACRSLGCACQLRASYSPMTNWNHGFATVEVRKDGTYTFENFGLDHEYNVFQT